MLKSSNYSAVGVSVGVHVVLLVALATLQQDLFSGQPDVVLETVFEDERAQEEFTQELETETEIAETQNLVAGGKVSTAIGGSGAPAVAQEQIEAAESLKEPDIRLNTSEISVPGENLLGEDLGEAEVSGEIGAAVEGYGAALGRITQELIRLMREQKVMVVWLFDESESMKDDQREIAQKFHKVYEELGIQQKTDEKLRGGEVLSTVILGFGKGIHVLTQKPTSNVNAIRAAIDKITIDTSGEENLCAAISGVIDNYGKMARSQKRKLVIVVVSDESPTDDHIATGKTELLEPTIERAKRANAPIYILGREAIFGYPYARIRWKDPVHGLTHWPQIDRGPETAYPEALQYDGFRGRWDTFSSGFGPYSQVRICKETGGIFFVLPGEEENLTGPGAHEKRQFEFLAMKEYQPLLLPRRTYAEDRQRSKFRTDLWNVIVTLNPHLDKQLNIRWWHYPLDFDEFREVALQESQKASRAMGLLNQAVTILENIEPSRAREDSQRWRAAYDLILAQCLSYRVRLFQYLLAIDQHVRDKPKRKKPKSNEWRINWHREMRTPDEEQFERIKKTFKFKGSRDEYLSMLQGEEERSRELYKLVKAQHPGTPWSRRADHEIRLGFSCLVYDAFHDPNYRKDIKIPKF